MNLSKFEGRRGKAAKVTERTTVVLITLFRNTFVHVWSGPGPQPPYATTNFKATLLASLAINSIPDLAQYNDALIAIRVLGFLLEDLWTNARKWNLGDTANSKMVEEINIIRMKPKDNQFDVLVALGLIYRNRLFQVCEW